MITLTEQAAQQVKVAIQQGQAEGLTLRIEIQQKTDGAFHYLMGFDDQEQVGDEHFESEGVKLVVGRHSKAFAQGMTLDFVDLEGKMEFIFLNPNDPNYSAPQQE